MKGVLFGAFLMSVNYPAASRYAEQESERTDQGVGVLTDSVLGYTLKYSTRDFTTPEGETTRVLLVGLRGRASIAVELVIGSLSSVGDRFERAKRDAGALTYSKRNRNDNWYVVAGVRGKNAHYEKVLIGPDTSLKLTIDFDEGEQDALSAAITLSSRSFVRLPGQRAQPDSLPIAASYQVAMDTVGRREPPPVAANKTGSQLTNIVLDECVPYSPTVLQITGKLTNTRVHLAESTVGSDAVTLDVPLCLKGGWYPVRTASFNDGESGSHLEYVGESHVKVMGLLWEGHPSFEVGQRVLITGRVLPTGDVPFIEVDSVLDHPEGRAGNSIDHFSELDPPSLSFRAGYFIKKVSLWLTLITLIGVGIFARRRARRLYRSLKERTVHGGNQRPIAETADGQRLRTDRSNANVGIEAISKAETVGQDRPVMTSCGRCSTAISQGETCPRCESIVNVSRKANAARTSHAGSRLLSLIQTQNGMFVTVAVVTSIVVLVLSRGLAIGNAWSIGLLLLTLWALEFLFIQGTSTTLKHLGARFRITSRIQSTAPDSSLIAALHDMLSPQARTISVDNDTLIVTNLGLAYGRILRHDETQISIQHRGEAQILTAESSYSPTPLLLILTLVLLFTYVLWVIPVAIFWFGRVSVRNTINEAFANVKNEFDDGKSRPIAGRTADAKGSTAIQLDDLERLATLRGKGIITNEEFDLKKKAILQI